MEIVETRDRALLEEFLRRDASTHIYPLADLDDFFWRETTWYAALDGGRIAALCLVLEKLELPILYAVAPPGDEPTRTLVERIRDRLPKRFMANFGLQLADLFRRDHEVREEAVFQKMILADTSAPPPLGVAGLDALGPEHLEELVDFYAGSAYEADESDVRFLAPYMLEMGPYFGVREGGLLVAAGGVHLVSDRYGVAALGNIATRPERRGHGLGRAVTAAVCRGLHGRAALIGLNVMVSNTAAIRCYERLGFRPVCRYLEGVFERRESRVD